MKSAAAPQLAIEWWPIDKPKPYAQNARKLSARAVETVAKSIREFGWRQPIVVDSKGVVVVGHTRLLAAAHLKLERVPVHVATGLTAAQVRAYRLMDNRSAEETEWDVPTLEAELAELNKAEIDLTITGFTSNEIDRALRRAGGIEEDFAPEPPETPTSRPGDVWLLDNHRITCGDCTDAAVVKRVLAGAEPHLMVTDPPYGILLDSEARDRALKRRIASPRETSIFGDDRADWSEAFALIPSLEIAYVWHASKYTREVLDGLLKIGFEHHQQIIWNKGLASMTRTHYWFQHEPCWFVSRHEPAWYVRKKNAPWFGKPGENTTVWEAPSPKMIMGGSKEEKFDHPTQKPVALMQRPIQNHLQRGGLVYEPFLGSGTTLIAAEMTERVCYGVELDPQYVDVVVDRWQRYSEGEAVLEASGQTFEVTKAKRAKR